jgi:hypothetical protein
VFPEDNLNLDAVNGPDSEPIEDGVVEVKPENVPIVIDDEF